MRKSHSKYRHFAASSNATNPRTPTILESREEDEDDHHDYPQGFHQWIRYELAALKIQRNFRKYRSVFRNQRNFKLYALQNIGRYALSYPRYVHSSTYVATIGHSNQQPISQLTQAMHCFHNIIQQNASFADKVYFWRVIQDLKHGFPQLSTDVLLKALLEAQGDYSKAQVLLADEDYVLLQGKSAVPSQVRMMFLPTIGPWEYQYTSVLYGDSSNTKGKSKNSLSPGRASFAVSPGSSTTSSPSRRPTSRGSTRISMRSTLNSSSGQRNSSVNNHVDTIKLLRSQHLRSRVSGMNGDSGDRETTLTKKQQLMELFMNVIEKTYFNKPPPPVISSTGTKITKK